MCTLSVPKWAVLINVTYIDIYIYIYLYTHNIGSNIDKLGAPLGCPSNQEMHRSAMKSTTSQQWTRRFGSQPQTRAVAFMTWRPRTVCRHKQLLSWHKHKYEYE